MAWNTLVREARARLHKKQVNPAKTLMYGSFQGFNKTQSNA